MQKLLNLFFLIKNVIIFIEKLKKYITFQIKFKEVYTMYKSMFERYIDALEKSADITLIKI